MRHRDVIGRGDMREVLARLEPDSVHCAVFSPPFWQLRKYPGDTLCEWPDGWCGQLGLEATVPLYIEHLMECMEAVRRVLRPEGVCFVELGDSFWGGNKGQGGYSDKQAYNRGSYFEGPRIRLRNQDNLKPKDLCLVPARFALACQQQGWWVRSIDPTETIAAPAIWQRPSPMPESCRDRPTVDFTFVFLLTKSEDYWYDQEAEREPLSPLTLADSQNDTGRHTHKTSGYGAGGPLSPGAPGAPSWYRAKTFVNPAQGRNLRAVWSFPSQPLGYNLCRACNGTGLIFSDWSSGERTGGLGRFYKAEDWAEPEKPCARCQGTGEAKGEVWDKAVLDAWPTQPGLVLDPFLGAGTVGVVAEKMGLRWLGVEMSEDYIRIAERRLQDETGLGVQEKLALP